MKLSQDLKPVSYFKNNMAEVIRKLNDSQGTMIITQNGEAKDMVINIRKACDSLSENPERTHIPAELSQIGQLEYRQIIY